jgi:hypothetical protein
MTRILIISPSDISRDPRVLRHVEVAKEFGAVTTCGYGEDSIPGTSHLQISPNVRFLPRNLFTLSLIKLHLHSWAARRSQFYIEAKSLLGEHVEFFDAVIVNDVHALQVIADLFPADRIWADMHEYAPLEGEHDWRWRLLYRRHIKFLCQVNLSKPKVVTSVGQVICDRYTNELNRPVVLLRNSSPYSPRLREVSTSLNGATPISLVHVGVSIRARKLENMIDAVKGKEGIQLTLFLLPTDVVYHSELLEICSQTSNVEMREPIPVSSIISEISKFDAGIVTIPPTSFNYENCLPNKLFQYLQARLPIITGPIPEIARIVEEEGIGTVSEGFDPDSIFVAVQEIRRLGPSSFSERLDTAAQTYSIDHENRIRRNLIQSLLSVDDHPISNEM